MSSITLTARLEREKVEAGKTHQMHLVVNLQGDKLASSSRKDLVLGLGFDASGSMKGEKIDYARRTALKLIDQMTERDVLGICAFSTTVWSILKPEKMTPEAKERARAAVEALRDLESTNLSGGLAQAYDLTRDAKSEGMVRSFLFTDGQPTCGEVDKNKLIAMAEALKPTPGGLSCFGFGDYDAELLDQMARKGGGTCYHIDSPDRIGPTFGKELGGLLSCVAQNIKVTVAGKTGVRLIEVMNDLDVEASPDKTQATIQVDDVYSEETRRLVLKLEIPAIEKGERPFKLGDIKVEYLDLVTKEPRSAEVPFKVQYVEKDEAQKDPDKEVADQVARIEARRAQEKALELAKAGDFDGAQSLVKGAAMACRSLGTDFGNAMADDLDHHVMHRLSADGYAAGGSHYVHANARSYDLGRAQSAGVESMFATQIQLETAKAFEDPSAGAPAGMNVPGAGVGSFRPGMGAPKPWRPRVQPMPGQGAGSPFVPSVSQAVKPAAAPVAPADPVLGKKRKNRS